MKRWVLVAAELVVTGAIVWLLAVNALALQHWIAVHTGTEHAGPDKFYNWWSGFGSDLGEVTLVTAIVTPGIVAARRANCHTRGCWRLGHTVTDPATGHAYHQCVRCDPHLKDHAHAHWWQHHFSDEHLAGVHARIAARKDHYDYQYPTTESESTPT